MNQRNWFAYNVKLLWPNNNNRTHQYILSKKKTQSSLNAVFGNRHLNWKPKEKRKINKMKQKKERKMPAQPHQLWTKIINEWSCIVAMFLKIAYGTSFCCLLCFDVLFSLLTVWFVEVEPLPSYGLCFSSYFIILRNSFEREHSSWRLHSGSVRMILCMTNRSIL